MNIDKKETLVLNNISLRSVYFLGIGGIGMSAIARYLLSRNLKVSGYDIKETVLTKELEKEGANIHYEEDINKIDKETDLVVYTPAIPDTHKELRFFKENNYPIAKRSDVLGWITKNSFNICVAGSHGKTTVTTMIAYLLRETNYGSNAFLGGIAANYDSNFWSDKKNVSVIEADEYDRSFHKLSPDIAVITAMDADHLDIYETVENVQEAYLIFASKIKKGGLLLTKQGLKREEEFVTEHHLSYHLDNKNADVYAENITTENGAYIFNVCYQKEKLQNVKIHMGGLHNIENALAAIAVAKYLNIDGEKIKEALKNFKGVKRRFENVLMRNKNNDVVLIDDYAHHPAELNALIKGVKSLYREEMLLIFQPHLYSRTQDLAKEFAISLDNADEVVILPIYPARELPVKGVTSDIIASKMKNKNKRLLSKQELLDVIENEDHKLIVMAGAGDIGEMVEEVKNIIQSKNK